MLKTVPIVFVHKLNFSNYNIYGHFNNYRYSELIYLLYLFVSTPDFREIPLKQIEQFV